MPTEKRLHGDMSWVKIGEKVRFASPHWSSKEPLPEGTRVMGEGDPDTAWLCVGALGTVIKMNPGYARHRCPDHRNEPDCVCGGSDYGESGWIEEMPAWATVEYETDKPGRTIKRAIHKADEGKDWTRALRESLK